MLGALIGDIIGSLYEFENWRSKDFELFGDGATFTDDSVCTVALASALLTGADPAATLQRWCRQYPGRGYGGMFMRWILSDAPKPYGSFGNGAAMRVSSAAWLGVTRDDALAYADRITAITHDHPEGLKGARATCQSIYMALHGATAQEIREAIEFDYGYDLVATVDEIRPHYSFDETCQGTVPQALICALTALDFEDAIRNAISIGGDSDTVAAIAGSIAEPLFGIPAALESTAMAYLPHEFQGVITQVRRRHANSRRAK